MFTERQLEIIGAALLFFMSNMHEAEEAFRGSGDESDKALIVNGERVEAIEEAEIEEVLKLVSH